MSIISSFHKKKGYHETTSCSALHSLPGGLTVANKDAYPVCHILKLCFMCLSLISLKMVTCQNRLGVHAFNIHLRENFLIAYSPLEF